MIEAGLSIGSNLGDRLGFLRAARQRVAALEGARLTAVSPVYETEPVDVPAASRALLFLNAVLIIETEGAPADLADRLHRIEDDLGRRRGADRNAPRTIDIDLIYFGGRAESAEWLRIPHPRWQERRFVAQPLADVRPHLVLPGTGGRSVREVLAELPAEPRVALAAAEW